MEERHVSVWEGREHKWAAGPAAALRLLVAQARLLKRPEPDFDTLIVGYPGHLDLPAARFAARGKPVVFNPLVSLADTLVDDRARFRRGSLPARALAAVDRRALQAADLVVADTEANADDFAHRARIPHKKVAVCFVGAEERVFQPGWAPRDPFSVLFVGKLIPLHGLDTVLDAARLLPDIPFRIVGSGQLERLLDTRPANVTWVPWIEYERLPEALHGAGCALGIFGTSSQGRPRDPEQGVPGISVRNAARDRRHAGRARAAGRRRERAARAAGQRGGTRGCDRATRRGSCARGAHRRSRPRRRTGPRRARTSSAPAGAACSKRCEGQDRALVRHRRVRCRLLSSVGAPPRGLQLGTIRPREHDAGGLVDRSRPPAPDDGHGR